MQNIFSEYIYLFIGETWYFEELVLSLKYKMHSYFLLSFVVNVCCKCLYIFLH